MVVSGEEKLLKPDPAIYRLALERFGLEAAGTVFIDDTVANVEGAAAVGLIAVRFTDATALRARLVDLGLPGVGKGRAHPLRPEDRHCCSSGASPLACNHRATGRND